MKFLFIFIFMGAISAQAKDLTNRLGVGFRSASSINDGPSILLSYYPNPEFSLLGTLSVDTAKENSKFYGSIDFHKILFKEDQMNFYMGGRLGFFNSEVSNITSSGFEVSALFGSEFFLSGLESLGFFIESGVGVLTGSSTRFRTLGYGPFQAGAVFYF